MTYKPTDAELKALWHIHAADIGGIFHYARAVLAKWGTPAGAAEPFCWHWENTFNSGTGTVKNNPETLGINMSHPDYKWTALYTAPQPTHAQAGAVPQYRLLVRGRDTIQADDEFLREDGVTWRKDQSRIFVGCMYEGTILLPARRVIKEGGQHGTE